VNRIHPYKGSTQSTGIMTLPGNRPVQRFQFGGRPVQRFQSGGTPSKETPWWQTAFSAVVGLLGNSVEAIARSVVTVGLPALIMGVSPRDALKLSAASGIASLVTPWGQATAGKKKEVPTGPPTPQEIAAMQQQGIKMQGVKFDPVTQEEVLGQAGLEYLPHQVEKFRKTGSALTLMTDPATGKVDERGFFESIIDVGTEPDKWKSLQQAFLPDTRAFQDKKDYIRQYGPLLGLGIGALWASGQFDPPKPLPKPDPWGGQTWRGLMEANPAAYRSAPTFVPRGQHGGIIQSFPRRNGSIRGPGTGTSDEIPAMLSDGEFVMTADAVRGAGNGNRKHGMRRMYDMMQNFEGAS